MSDKNRNISYNITKTQTKYNSDLCNRKGNKVIFELFPQII